MGECVVARTIRLKLSITGGSGHSISFDEQTTSNEDGIVGTLMADSLIATGVEWPEHEAAQLTMNVISERTVRDCPEAEKRVRALKAAAMDYLAFQRQVACSASEGADIERTL